MRTLEIRPDYHCDLKMCLLNSFAGAKFVDLVKHSPKMWCIVWFENCQTEFGSMGRGGGGGGGGGEFHAKTPKDSWVVKREFCLEGEGMERSCAMPHPSP